MYLVGVPTLRQQAELFIRSLRLGTNADEPTDSPTTKPTTQHTRQTTRPLTTQPSSRTTRPPRQTTHPLFWTTRPPPQSSWPVHPSHVQYNSSSQTTPLLRTTRPTSQYTSSQATSFPFRTSSSTTYRHTTAPTSIIIPYRRRRQVPIPAGSDYCPSLTEQANNRICHNVCPRGM